MRYDPRVSRGLQRLFCLVIVAGLAPSLFSAFRGAIGTNSSGLVSVQAGATEADSKVDDGPLSGWELPGRDGHEFYFTRAYYGSSRGDFFRGFPSWSVDFPKADQQFLLGVQRLVNHLDVYEWENPVALTDPRLLDFPFLYAVEVGYMSLDESEIVGLRRYLMSGGFLVVDDFWGRREWANFEFQMAKVLPEYPIVELPLDHPIFSVFYDVEEIVQVPNVGNGRMGGPTWEKDGFVPHVRGILDDEGRLMVVINFNSDLGDAWEWAEDPYYPLEFSTYAYQVGVNFVIYSMTH